MFFCDIQISLSRFYIIIADLIVVSRGGFPYRFIFIDKLTFIVSRECKTRTRVPETRVSNPKPEPGFLPKTRTRTRLMTIPPTSVETERLFSHAGHILSKRRNRMADKTLDSIVFLKHYFMQSDPPKK